MLGGAELNGAPEWEDAAGVAVFTGTVGRVAAAAAVWYDLPLYFFLTIIFSFRGQRVVDANTEIASSDYVGRIGLLDRCG